MDTFKMMDEDIERILIEICEINKKPTFDLNDINNLDKLHDMLKDATTAKTMIEYGGEVIPDEYSMAMSSMRRSRSPVTGRYVSNTNFREPAYNNDGMGGYSGHSIHDRAIAMLEGAMDTTQSQYERQELARIIEQVRNGNR